MTASGGTGKRSNDFKQSSEIRKGVGRVALKHFDWRVFAEDESLETGNGIDFGWDFDDSDGW